MRAIASVAVALGLAAAGCAHATASGGPVPAATAVETQAPETRATADTTRADPWEQAVYGIIVRFGTRDPDIDILQREYEEEEERGVTPS
jgi:hypothetical protein